MPAILCIDTSTNQASAALTVDEHVIGLKISAEQKEHASFLQPAIQTLLKETGIAKTDLSAVAVTIGPGSYTGLRVGLASAKGLCYALQIPLITIITLELMAEAATIYIHSHHPEQSDALLCPMIDARRMEIFTALYNSSLQIMLEPQAVILNETSFQQLLINHQIVFFGNGAAKWQAVSNHTNAVFYNIKWNAADMATMAFQKFRKKEFASLSYATPLYLKEFYSAVKTG